MSHAPSSAAPTAPGFPDAVASDPVVLGWMVGSPPPEDRIIRWSNRSFYTFPKHRWSMSNWREFLPTREISRGDGPVVPLPRAERTAEIDAVTFQPWGSDQTMTWGESLLANYTDGIVVLHKGNIVYERYFGVLKPEGQHIMFSVTKSYIGTLAAMLAEEGTLDPDALVTKYIPELQDSAFGTATVRQVMDMTTGIQFSEEYADPNADVWSHAFAGNILPPPADWTGPRSFAEFLTTVKKQGEHDEEFGYRTANTDVLGWLIARSSGKRVADLLSERIWSKLGAEQDAYINIDTAGMEFAGGGMSARLRDQARFGEMMRLDGMWNGQQVVQKAVVEDIRNGADKDKFARSGRYDTLVGWSYRDQWWVLHNDHAAFTAIGVHGQLIYIDPKAEMVIARFASHPLAASDDRDATSYPAYHALARHLIAYPG